MYGKKKDNIVIKDEPIQKFQGDKILKHVFFLSRLVINLPKTFKQSEGYSLRTILRQLNAFKIDNFEKS